MNSHQEVIKSVQQLRNTLEVYGSQGMDASALLAGSALSILASSDDPDDALRDIKRRFITEVQHLEAERGEWLNEKAPKAIAKAVAYAEGDEVAFPGGSIWN